MTDYKPKENLPGFDQDLDMEGVELKDIAEPSAADSAATKGYVDAALVAAAIAQHPEYATATNLTTLSDSVDARVKKATVTLTATEIKALNATPKTIVAAPGLGKTLILDRILARIKWVGVQYTGGSALSVIFTGGSVNQLAGTLAATFLTAPTGAVTDDAILAALGTQLAAPQNTALQLKAAGAEFAAGDSTLELQVFYRIAAATA